MMTLKPSLLLLLVSVCAACASVAQGAAPHMRGPSVHSNISDSSSRARPVSIVLRFYRHYVTISDSDRCQMMPSCSIYAQEAFSRFGVIKGFLMTADRLTRCSNDMNSYNAIWVNDIKYAVDPVPDEEIMR